MKRSMRCGGLIVLTGILAGCSSTHRLYEGKYARNQIAVVMWHSAEGIGYDCNRPMIKDLKIDGQPLEGSSVAYNRAEVLPGAHRFQAVGDLSQSHCKSEQLTVPYENPAKVPFDFKSTPLVAGGCYRLVFELVKTEQGRHWGPAHVMPIDLNDGSAEADKCD